MTEQFATAVSAWGRVNHYVDPEEWGRSLCGVELIRPPDSITAWTLCRKCEHIAAHRSRPPSAAAS